MKIHRILVVLALICISSLASAQWQWLDKDGRKVFSDRAPPPEVPDKSILKRPNAAANAAAPAPAAAEGSTGNAAAPTPPATPPSAIGAGVDKELEAKKKQLAEAEAAKRRAEEEKFTRARVENCARAKQALADLESGVRISRTNATGEREILGDAARAAEVKRVQSIVASDCR